MAENEKPPEGEENLSEHEDDPFFWEKNDPVYISPLDEDKLFTDVPETERETYAEKEKKIHALHVVESIEQLHWYANAWNESVPQVRLYFEKILAGLDPDGEDESETEWTDAEHGEQLPAYLSMESEKKRAKRANEKKSSEGVKEERKVETEDVEMVDPVRDTPAKAMTSYAMDPSWPLGDEERQEGELEDYVDQKDI